MSESNSRLLRDVLREAEGKIQYLHDRSDLEQLLCGYVGRFARELRAVGPLLRRLGKRLESTPGGVCGDSYDAIKWADEFDSAQ